MELHEKEYRDRKYIGKLIKKNPKIKDAHKTPQIIIPRIIILHANNFSVAVIGVTLF